MADVSIRLDDVIDKSLEERERGLKLVDDIRMTEEATLDDLSRLAHQTPDTNPALVSVNERSVIASADAKLRQAVSSHNQALSGAIWDRLVRVYLTYKRSAIQDKLAQRTGQRAFKPPPLKLPTLEWEEATGSRTTKDTVAVCRWIASIKQTKRLLGISDLTALEIVRDKVPDSLKSRVLNVLSLPELYAIAIGEVPDRFTTATEIERRLSTGPPSGPDSQHTPSMVEKYARDTLDLVEELASVEPRMDIPLRLATSIVESFPSAFGGSYLIKRKMLTEWQEKFQSNHYTMVSQLRCWLEEIKTAASKQAAREKSYGPLWSKVPKSGKEATDLSKRVMAIETRVRERFDKQNGNGGMPAGGRGAPSCYACESSDHMVASCDLVRRIRDNGDTPPSGLCLFCLHQKKPGERHFIDERSGCHIAPATARQQRLKGDRGLRRDYLCYEHKVALPLCRPCFVSETKGKANEVPQPKYLGTK